MKKRLFLLIGICVWFFPLCAFAQIAKIVDLGGQVAVKKGASSEWEEAKINMFLNKDAEVETKKNSYCTLAFDEEEKNIITLKQNSRIKIDSIKPGNILLPKGRVFSIIKNLSQAEKFQIRTPVAIAGARGTGWVTDSNAANTSATCFQDTIYVQGLDEEGNITEEEDLSSGMGMDIGSGGILGEPYRLSDTDYREWDDFSGYVDEVTADESQEGTVLDEGTSQDLRQEQREDLRGDSGETRREESTPREELRGVEEQ